MLNTRLIATVMVLTFSHRKATAKECYGMEIRHYEQLSNLTDCTVVLGNLALVFPIAEYPNYPSEEINNISFPLREVTGFMLLYSVAKLNTLETMFPSLTIIRGQRLFFNYALVIYATNLHEITLPKLQKISRGSVRIDGQNTNLCLPEIDWDRIIVNGKLYMENTKSKNCTSARFDLCNTCAEAFKCWNSRNCQRFQSFYFHYDKKLKTKYECHSSCLGSCKGPTENDCYTCKNLSEDSACVDRCSDSRYLNADTRRCLTNIECTAQNRSIYEERCLENCPPGFMPIETIDKNLNIIINVCEKCPKKCPKICKLQAIRGLSQLEKLGTGCTEIQGDLDINIVEDIENLEDELKTYLGSVETIRGFIKIHRSPPLTELTFLNQLKVVTGRENRVSILIFENQNLQKLFDWRARDNMKLKINIGEVQIYKNNLLCGNEIRSFLDNLDRSRKYIDITHNNGLKTKCTNSTIETSCHVLSHDSVLLKWKDANPQSLQEIDAYILQYVAMKSLENVDDEMIFERDTCSFHSWQQVYVKKEDLNVTADGKLEFNLTGLKQFTNYAFTVQTYFYTRNSTNNSTDNSTLDEKIESGAKSTVKIFKTFLFAPSRVENLKVLNKTASSIQLQWKVSESEIGAIAYFSLDIFAHPFNKTLIDSRDFCADPYDVNDISFTEFYELTDDYDDDNDRNLTCCEKCCAYDKERKKAQLTKINDFEDVLIKFSEKVPKKNLELNFQTTKLPNFIYRTTINKTLSEFTIGKLNSTTAYIFYFRACGEDSKCSSYSLLTETTDKNPNDPFDRIQLAPASFFFESDYFHLSFNEPKFVNGIILNYIIEIREIIGNSSVFLQSDCITRKQHEMNRFKFSLHDLTVGRYVFRVRADSLGGKGVFTDFHEFLIIKAENKMSKGWFLLGAVLALLLICITTVSYYYKHKIMLWKRKSDTIHLLDEIEPIDFHEISLHHRRREISETF